jgi:hypothetical protein
LLDGVSLGELRHSQPALRKHQRLGDEGISDYCVQGNCSTAGVPNKVHRADAQLFDKRNEVGDMLTEAELPITAPWLRKVGKRAMNYVLEQGATV